MSKAKTSTAPKDWKWFRLADGTRRLLPDWADKPLQFSVAPDEALRRCAFNKLPADRKKLKRATRR
jgi:hypothetical protein